MTVVQPATAAGALTAIASSADMAPAPEATAKLSDAERTQLRSFLLQVPAKYCVLPSLDNPTPPCDLHVGISCASCARLLTIWWYGESSLAAEEQAKLERRSPVLQERWFSQREGVTTAQISTLKQLPIFSAGQLPDINTPSASAPPESSSQAAATSTGPSRFVDLQQQRHLAPSDYPPALLGNSFVVVDSPAEASLLVGRLGVVRLNRVAFLRQHLFPAVAAMPAEPRNAAFLSLLGDLEDLRREDALLLDELRKVRRYHRATHFLGTQKYNK